MVNLDPLHIQIICPVRNGGAALAETLEALAEIRDDNVSLLISDNYSEDGDPWRNALSRLNDWQWEIIQPPEPMGRIEHWNWLFGRAEGDLIKPLFVGDRIGPNYLNTIRKCFAQNPDLSFVFSRFVVLEKERELPPVPNLELSRITYDDYLKNCFEHFNVFGPMSALTFARAPLRKALPFPLEYPWNADWRLFIECLRHGPSAFIKEEVIYFNQRIVRFSSGPRAAIYAAIEDWRFLAELQRISPYATAGDLWHARLKLVVWHAVMRLGKFVLPKFIQRFFGWCLRKFSSLD